MSHSGPANVLNETGTGEIWDPVANVWTPVAPFPNQSCGATTFAGSLTNGSPVVTSLPASVNWQVGWNVAGSGVPTGATILSVDSPTQIHLSANATITVGSVLTVTVVTTGNLAKGSNIITGIPSTTGFQSGWLVAGTGLAGTTISSIDSAGVHVAASATADATAVALTFTVRSTAPTCFGDQPSMLLPGGKILAGSNSGAGNSYFYNYLADTWAVTAARKYGSSGETGWVLLDDGTVLTYDIFKSNSAGKGYAERYDPVANLWSGISPADGTANGTLPLLSSSAVGSELGPALRLADGRIFIIGASGHTALYTPSTNTWAAGPDIMGTIGGTPFLFAADDAPAAVLPNGHVILAADAGLGVSTTGTTTTGSPIVTDIPSTAQLLANWAVSGTGIASSAAIKTVDSATQVTLNANATATGALVALKFGATFSFPTQLFDFDPSTNQISPVAPAIPNTRIATGSAYVTRMLMLPVGQLLFADGSNKLWVYTPDGEADPSLQPVVSTITANTNGLFTLGGTGLSGQSAGATYGDDAEMDENYPIVSLANAAGSVYYARTTNWSYIGVGGGTTPQTVDFALPAGMPSGTYSITVSAAGIASTPVAVNVGAGLTKITVLPTVRSVQGAESARKSVVAGQWTAIYGLGLANSSRIWTNADFPSGISPGSPLPTTLDGVQVTVGGLSAPILYISPSQIDIQIPANVKNGNADVIVKNGTSLSAAIPVTIVDSAPEFFSYGAGGTLFPSAVHLSAKLIGDPAISGASVEKAHPNETIVMYASGLAASQAGVIVTGATFTPAITMSAGTYTLKVLGAALVSAGEFQINVQLPPDIQPGNYNLTLTLPNGSSSTSGVTVVLPVGP